MTLILRLIPILTLVIIASFCLIRAFQVDGRRRWGWLAVMLLAVVFAPMVFYLLFIPG